MARRFSRVSLLDDETHFLFGENLIFRKDLELLFIFVLFLKGKTKKGKKKKTLSVTPKAKTGL